MFYFQYQVFNYIILDQLWYLLLNTNSEDALNINEVLLNISHLFPTKGYVFTFYGSIIALFGSIIFLFKQKLVNEIVNILFPLFVVMTGFIGMLMSVDWYDIFNLSILQGGYHPIFFISTGGLFIIGVILYIYLNYIRKYLQDPVMN